MKSRKVQNAAQSIQDADGIYTKLCIYIRPVQKEANLPGLHLHSVLNLVKVVKKTKPGKKKHNRAVVG